MSMPTYVLDLSIESYFLVINFRYKIQV